ncbi:Signal transduction histidine kinase [Rhizobiales bacterium GAS191]|nr:Signal transduction histidine kinase [Rhizobiales bacterium GAS188]SEE81112.1 Signal transduction histidine kinase [Rhizobiales bacterium GAS191]
MRAPRPRSLKWRLVRRLVVLQAGMLTLLILILIGVGAALWRSGVIANDYEGSTLDVLRDAIERDAGGGLALRPTPELAHLRTEVADLWFVIRDEEGRHVSEGAVPSEFAGIASSLDHISDARLGWKIGEASPPAGLVKWVDTAAGKVQVLTGTGGKMSLRKVITAAPLVFLNIILPIVVLMALATLVATPFVVRRAMAGLGQAAAQAEGIDIDRRGVQLSVDEVPIEIIPLVKAVNDALGRLDKGYERHRRFLADAAHELRTPIAILNTRLSSLPAGPDKTRLLEDATRLSVLTGQLLDLQRLDQQSGQLCPVDLVAIARRVVLDLAPLAFAAGYEMSFEPQDKEIVVKGDQTSLERALTNLVQNAIDHGGRRGTILVRVARAGCVEVCDEGSGIPVEEREQVFEPFYRLRQDGRGAGLGLNLVQKIMHLHGGRVEAVDGPSAGACLRMIFPKVERTVEETRAHAT